MTSEPDVLVVGAGPVGLFCANELERHGLTCRIIEKKAGLSDKSKALGLHIRTLDVFRDCGFLEAILEQGHKVHGITIKSEGKKIAEADFSHIGANRDYLIDLPQDKTELILHQGLLEKEIPVEWLTELVSIEQFPNGVAARVKNADNSIEKINTQWIIACDGAHSTLRHLVNAEFLGGSYDQTWWLADLHVNWTLPEDKMVIYASPKGPLACFPMGNHRYRLVLTAPAGSTTTPSMKDIIQMFNERSSDPASLTDPVWITAFSIHHRQIQQYRHDRIFFAGDAAHIHSPMGGQGLNTGIQDIYNLIWKLALVQKDFAGENLLNSYQEERYPVGKGILKKTDVMTKMILLKNPLLIVLRNHLAGWVTHFDCLRHAIAKDLAELKISYAKSSIVKTLGERTPFKAGEFVPVVSINDVKNDKRKTLEDICEGTSHHMFLFIVNSQNADEMADMALDLANHYQKILQVHWVFLDKPTSANFPSMWIGSRTDFKLKKSTALLVRPDKYIGLVQSPVNLVQCQASLQELFLSRS